jgi:GT2 family glycosyltransferase
VDVIVISYNTRDVLDACLEALGWAGAGRVIVVDNASVDGSQEMVLQRHPGVILVQNPCNVGYGAAANQGIEMAESACALLLNSDAIVAPGGIEALHMYLDFHPRVAIVGPRILHPDGRLQPSCNSFPTLFPTALAESSIGRLLRYIPWLRELYLPTSSHAHERRVPWVMGSALAIRRVAFEQVGGFDESYFMYFEEVDLCYRLARAGWEVHFAPVTSVKHVGGASTRRHRSEMALRALASRLHFYRAHYRDLRVPALILLIDAILCTRLLVGPLRLLLARDDEHRARLKEDLRTWQRAVRGEWLRVST